MHTLGRRVLVVAFDGWNDAGEAATAATDQLRGSRSYERVFSVDPELYFDYMYSRPHVETDADGRRALRWPEATIWRPQATARGTRLWILSGAEPARAWKSFAADLIDAALSEDVTGIVALGSMMSDVPHTRPITVFSSSENDELRSALSLERSTYEGPVGILSVITSAAEEAGIPTASLWASVPHYVAGHSPSPKATLALLDKLEEITGAKVARGSLPGEALAWEATIDAAAADDEEMTEYIRQLEQTRDTWDSPEASGEAIAQEFERYLRHRGDGGPGPGRGRPPRR
ncbi:PAC2 family protein [Microbacterium radiodurans]|uniref:PAC2 family protein n=1 Tax=Microbacterium radiodurans TaxID=661398 RepID=A0A5J5IUS9_9MICO|nr:PAC2 family protein [Microbacterium radiodurans]KAA9086762.1 PAC2 family protein [Microbacterium radiodurans]